MGKKAENDESVSKGSEEDDSTSEENGSKSEIMEDINDKMDKISMKIRRALIKFKEYFLGQTKKQKQETEVFFGKSFVGLLILFLGYSLVLVAKTKGSTADTPLLDQFFSWVTFNNPYVMGTSLVFTFILLMFAFCNTAIKRFLFAGKHVWLKQLLIFPSLIIGNFILINYLVDIGFNIMPVLFVLAMFWLIFQGVRLYFTARKYSTKVESRLLSKYSVIRYIFVLITPFVILGFLTVVVWAYRYGLIKVTLDFIPYWSGEPSGAVIQIYAVIIHIILPFLYITLILIFALITIEFILTRRRTLNRRAGAFDNMTYALIVLFMFYYLLYQISMYLFVNEQTTDALKDISGAAAGTSYLFWVEFAVSMLFLFRAIFRAGKSIGWKILFFNQDAIMMGFFAAVIAQTTSRLALYSEIPGQSVGAVTNLLSMDHLLIPILIMAFLGLTIIVYYINPQETSMFLRIEKETIDKEDRAMEIITKFLKREFIKRGQKFPINEIEPQLLAITDLPKGVVHSLLHRIPDKYIDIEMVVEETDEGKVKYIDFISITEKYQSGKHGDKRSQQFMRSKLVDTLGHNRKRIRLTDSKKKITDVEERETFLSALGSGYRKKVIEQEKRAKDGKTRETLEKSFDKEIDRVTGDVIYEIIKREYIYRISHPAEYSFEQCRIKVSEISGDVFRATKVSAGTLYPLMAKWSEENWNIQLLDLNGNRTSSINDSTDYYVDFNPITDFEISDAVLQYRPKRLMLIRKVLLAWLDDAYYLKKEGIKQTIRIQSRRVVETSNYNVYLPGNFELDIYYHKLIDYFDEHYMKRMNQLIWKKDTEPLRKSIELIKKANDKSKKSKDKKNKKSEKD